jgi:hypothetical protein
VIADLADPRIRARCHERLAKLNPDAPPLWGRMNARQMVCHLNDSFLAAIGEKPVSSVSNLFTRTVMKFFALRVERPWPQGIATRPEVEQGRGGTPPGEWERDCAALAASLDRFAGWGSEGRRYAVHAIFGPLTAEEWRIWGYRHVDHHFRQFGV